jgi:hypothetical protein
MGLKDNLACTVYNTSNERVLDASHSRCKVHNTSNGGVIDASPEKNASKCN